MESSHVYGAPEECHSNESGWTMYIGSPTTDEDDDHLNTNNVNGDSYEAEEENSDDSMASDASSGPSHWWVNGKIHSKNDKDSIVMMRGKNHGYSDKSFPVPNCKTSKNPSSSVKKKKEKNGGGGGEKEESSVHSAKSHKERRSCGGGFWKGKTGK
ncbi:PREDICTED: uncharacterized protein LOC109184099 [Ipomoea nil]|uniref:uncharacterized protein LOC109184099 n=1 Tax=Ipomoea nil TaxID=35883 RepID=UPI0009019D92|nr:PREDICTED: uncharacterized protein LOC109184099 [Ipomoea nil]